MEAETHGAPGGDPAPATGLSQVIAEYERNGFLILRGFASAAEVRFLRERLMDKLGAAPDQGTSLVQKTDVTWALSHDDASKQLLQRLASRAPVLPLFTALHQRPTIDHTKALIKLGGGKPTPWHQDASYWHTFDPAFTMGTLWLALSRCNRDTSCMRFIPGSHRQPLLPSFDLDKFDKQIPDDAVSRLLADGGEVVDCVLEPGDAVVFHNRLVHSAHPNAGSETRYAVKLVFVDLEKRKPDHPLHPTAMPIAPAQEIRGGEDVVRGSFTRRLAQAARLLGPPFSTPFDLIRKRRAERAAQAKKPFTETFGPLRQLQLAGTDREWSQLLHFHELLTRLDGTPGDVVELGVAGGLSLLCIVRTLRVLERSGNPRHRRMVYGFDSFEGLPELGAADQVATQADSEMKAGGFRDERGYEELFAFAARETHVKLIKGWFDETLPVFLRDHPATAFALVHVDCDLYASTKVVLDLVWDRVVPGGVVAFDELYHPDYPGETIAFREFARGRDLTIHQSRVWPDKKYIVKKG